MSDPRRAAVTGGSGFIGGELLKRLVPNGGTSALFRAPGPLSEAWAKNGCRVAVGDLNDPVALADLLRGADTVYHLAATMAKGNPLASHQVNVLGTENLVRAALAAGVGRFVYISSISVYAATPRPDHWIDETTAPDHTDRLNAYSKTKLEGELVVRRLAGGGRMPFTIVRPTNVYGPGSGPWFRQFERMLHRVPVAIGNLPIDVVYVDDLIDGLIGSAESSAGADELFHLGHETVHLNRFILEVARATGQRAWLLPGAADRLLRGVIDWGYRAATGTCMSMSLVQPVRYPHAKASRAFGYAPTIRLADGFARLTEWYRAGRGPV